MRQVAGRDKGNGTRPHGSWLARSEAQLGGWCRRPRRDLRRSGAAESAFRHRCARREESAPESCATAIHPHLARSRGRTSRGSAPLTDSALAGERSPTHGTRGSART